MRDDRGRIHEVVKISYKDNDVVFVSVHSLHKISRYRSKDGEAPKINKLGSKSWQNLKSSTKSKVKDIAKELGARGVRANCIAPGFILTEMTSRLPDNLKDMWIQDTLLKRAGLPEDVANVALFLASELSSYITGETINCSAHMRN